MAYDITKLVTLGQLKSLASKVKSEDAILKGNTTDASTAITIYGARALADTKVASVAATANKGIVIAGTATDPTVGIKLSETEGNDLVFDPTDGGLYYATPAAATISVVKKGTADTGFIASYNVTVDGEVVGETINIPKDYLVKSAEIKVCTSSDTAVIAAGIAVGEKYIDFTVNTVEGSGSESHIYLGVADLAHVYTAGNGIDISSADAISVKVATSGANGLSADSDGLKLATVVASTSGVGGSNGAMTAAQAEKLAGISEGANKVEAQAQEGYTGYIAIDGVKTEVFTAPVASDTEVSEMIAEIWA